MNATEDATLVGLLEAILAEPESDELRLVYADRLEETGRDERGGLVRVQIELGKLGMRTLVGVVEPTHRCVTCGALWIDWPNDGGWSLLSAECDSCCDNEVMSTQIRPLTVGQVRMLRRERDLLERNWHPWAFPSSTYCANFGNVGAFGVLFRRGFVEAVRLDAASWLRHCEDLTRAAPVREVTLTTWVWPVIDEDGFVRGFRTTEPGNGLVFCRDVEPVSMPMPTDDPPPHAVAALQAVWDGIRFTLPEGDAATEAPEGIRHVPLEAPPAPEPAANADEVFAAMGAHPESVYRCEVCRRPMPDRRPTVCRPCRAERRRMQRR